MFEWFIEWLTKWFAKDELEIYEELICLEENGLEKFDREN